MLKKNNGKITLDNIFIFTYRKIKKIEDLYIKKKDDLKDDEDEENDKFDQGIYLDIAENDYNIKSSLNEEKNETKKYLKGTLSKIEDISKFFEISHTGLNTLENMDININELINYRLNMVNIEIQIDSGTALYNKGSIDHIQKLNLSYNKISSIPLCIQNFKSLKILNLSYNNISDLNQITALSKIQLLIFLILKGNKICNIHGYRHFILEMCPVLERLDNSDITEKELDIIHFGGSKYGEIRKKGKVVVYPMNDGYKNIIPKYNSKYISK